jgi:corrinoid protein of di/trimethylamine methyltransferase
MNYFLERCSEAVSSYNTTLAGELAQEALARDLDLPRVIEEGFGAGLAKAGKLWEEGEYFLPELMMASEAMKTVMTQLAPALEKRRLKAKHLGKVVIGTVEGDIHDIGKSLVAAILAAGGFEVVDLGIDVPVADFVDTALREEADLLCMSALLTTTMPAQRRTIEALRKVKSNSFPKTLVGGAPTNEDWAAEIGADGYAPDAMSALELAKRLVSQ